MNGSVYFLTGEVIIYPPFLPLVSPNPLIDNDNHSSASGIRIAHQQRVMDRKPFTVRWLVCALLIVIGAVWFAFGCGGGGAAPTGGSSTPVAVELPKAFDLGTFDTITFE